MFTKAIRIRALIILAATVAASNLPVPNLLLADQPTSTLKPVPPMRSVPNPLRGNAGIGSARIQGNNAGQGVSNPGTDNASTASQHLSWRPSEKVAPELPATPLPTVQPTTVAEQPSLVEPTSLGALIAQSPSPRQTRNSSTVNQVQSSVLQVAYTQDADQPVSGGFYIPGPADGALPPRVAMQPPTDPFKDPFGDRTTPADGTAGRLIVQPQDQAPQGGFFAPPLTENSQSGEETLPVPNQPDLNLDSTDLGLNPWKAGDEPGTEPVPTLDSPSDQRSTTPPSLSTPKVAPGLEYGESAPLKPSFDASSDPSSPESRPKLGQYSTTSCDELRERLASRTIRSISLDIAPPFHPDILEKDKFDERKKSFEEDQLPRVWRNLNGEMLTEGKFIGLEFDHAVIEQQDGQQVEVLLRRLSEPDLAYVTKQWGLPQECQMPNIPFQPREWLPMTMTWKASGLCHKPLYFEDVNLERYGQTTGPFAQPLISTAHFFVNIAVLPYKMGIHPPNECQYALGYYRPGNCAPWIIPPVPISLRGALFQAGAIGTGIVLIP